MSKVQPINRLSARGLEDGAAPTQGEAIAPRLVTGEAPAAKQNPPIELPHVMQRESGAPANARRTLRQRWTRWALFALLPLALIAGSYWYVAGGQVMSTDDAYVEADKVGVSTDVSGIVKEVDVTENQHVNAGQVLYRLDDLPFGYALDRAEAQAGIVRNDLNALKANYQDMQAQIKQAQDDIDYYATEFHRQQDLSGKGFASQQTFDTARRNLQAAQQKVASLKQ
jgi:membrane fusion protein, multidrug efflux system